MVRHPSGIGDGDPSYCSYGCGALSQPQYCKSALKSETNRE